MWIGKLVHIVNIVHNAVRIGDSMNRTNRGKDFEAEIRACFEAIPNVSVDRLPDPMGGYSGVKNICDYVIYHRPDTFFIECKCLYGNTLNFKADISKNQWEGMTIKSGINGCVAGVAVWFIDYDVTAFVPIQILNEQKAKGAKSLNINDLIGEEPIKHFKIDGVKKRVMYKYFGDSFLLQLHKLAKEYWGEYRG